LSHSAIDERLEQAQEDAIEDRLPEMVALTTRR
jgi:hypothetical protein